MDIREAKAKEQALEERILSLVDEFESATGMSVVNIRVGRTDAGTFDQPDRTMLEAVRIDTLL